jgi:hypothetical protein
MAAGSATCTAQEIVGSEASVAITYQAWPFLVGGVICLLNCDNERDLNLLTSDANLCVRGPLLRGTVGD